MKRSGLFLLIGAALIISVVFWGFTEVSAEEPIYLPIIIAPPYHTRHCVCGFAEFKKLSVQCAYSWTPRTGSNTKFIPMIRDITEMDHLLEAVENAQASGWLMGFNEPDREEPAGHKTTPTEGARAQRRIEMAAVGINLLSPATSRNLLG